MPVTCRSPFLNTCPLQDTRALHRSLNRFSRNCRCQLNCRTTTLIPGARWTLADLQPVTPTTLKQVQCPTGLTCTGQCILEEGGQPSGLTLVGASDDVALRVQSTYSARAWEDVKVRAANRKVQSFSFGVLRHAAKFGEARMHV